MGLCRKEAGESQYWLRMIAAAEPACKSRARLLWREARERHLILAKIVRDMKQK